MKKLTYEAGLAELQAVISQIESGELTLEEMSHLAGILVGTVSGAKARHGDSMNLAARNI